ncbi:MAG: hypothetical protein AABZ44_09790 [Elusimicrobiota bacterium]
MLSALTTIALLLSAKPLVAQIIIVEPLHNVNRYAQNLDKDFNGSAAKPDATRPVKLPAKSETVATKTANDDMATTPTLPEEEITLPKPPEKIEDITKKVSKKGGDEKIADARPAKEIVTGNIKKGVALGAVAGLVTGVATGVALGSLLIKSAGWSTAAAVAGGAGIGLGILLLFIGVGYCVGALTGMLKAAEQLFPD